jgi:hypothetical protein
MDYDKVLPADADASLLRLHAKMFATAGRFDIPDLLLVAANNCSVRCLTSWEPIELLASIRGVFHPEMKFDAELCNFSARKPTDTIE